MLSLIPAVLMLLVHGPTGVERANADGKLGIALQVWAAKQAKQEVGRDLRTPLSSIGELEALLALSQDSPELSRFLVQVLQLSASLEPVSDCPPIGRPADRNESLIFEIKDQPSDGFMTCRRVRDGPFGA